MWTEGEEGATGKLVVYDLDARAGEVAATWAAGETPPDVCYLPNPTLPQSPYTGRDPGGDANGNRPKAGTFTSTRLRDRWCVPGRLWG
jgi:hypothetical protein